MGGSIMGLFSNKSINAVDVKSDVKDNLGNSDVKFETTKSNEISSTNSIDLNNTNKIEEDTTIKREIVRVSKIGSDHSLVNKNNHDFAFNLLNMKVVCDGCGSGNHSEVGTRIFAQLFAREAKELLDMEECINEDNILEVIDNIFKKMLNLCSDTSFLYNNYCFTILLCFELEDEFVVYSCGDGYIITESKEGIKFEKLDDGEYPKYYIYNYIEDKSALSMYKDGVTFTISRYSKDEYTNVGVATDGLRFAENLLDVEKDKFIKFLHLGKGKMIEVLINRNNKKNNLFHDDISICF